MKKTIIIGMCILILITSFVSAATTIKLQNSTNEVLADVYLYNSTGDDHDSRVYFKFNISVIPSGNQILNATLFLRGEASGSPISFGAISQDINISRMNNQAWDESNSSAAIFGISTFNHSFQTGKWCNSGSCVSSFNVSDMVRYEYNQNNDFVSFKLADPDHIDSVPPISKSSTGSLLLIGSTVAGTRNFRINSRQEPVLSQRPYLNITFEEVNATPVVQEALTNPNNPLPDQNINFNITCTDSDDITAYLQIYNGSLEFGSEISQVVLNNTNTLLHTIGFGNTSLGDNWTGEYWCGDGNTNSSKVNSTVTVVQTLIEIVKVRDTLGTTINGITIQNLNTSFSVTGNPPQLINSTPGKNIIKLSKAFYFDINYSINAIDNQTVSLSNLTMYDSKYEIRVRASEDNSSIEDFNMTIQSLDNLSVIQSFVAANTSLNFNITSGNYRITTSATSRGQDISTVIVPAGTSSINITLFPINTINFTIVDLTNLSILNHQNVDIELVGTTRTYNISTSTGQVFISDINDDTYQIITNSAGFDESRLIVTTSSSPAQDVIIYMDKGKTSKLFFTVDTSTNRAVPDTILTFTRNINGTFVTTAQVTTDFSGAASVLLNENITYTFTAINPQYNVFTGDVNPATSSTFTIDMILTGGLPYSSLLNEVVYSTVITTNNLDTVLNTSFSVFSLVTPGIIEWFSTNATYNGSNFFINTTTSPGGGIQIRTIPINVNDDNTVNVNYKFKIVGFPTQSWNEVTNFEVFNQTNITITGGLFDDTDELSEAGRGILAIFIIIIVVGVFTVASGNLTLGSFAGLSVMGIMVLPSVGLLPQQYGIVSLIVLSLLIIMDRVTGGAI